MAEVSIAEAKAKLSEIIARVEAGETQVITRRGKPVGKIVPIDAQVLPARKPFDFERLRRHLDAMPVSDVTGADLVRRMRDEED